jgi:hypothetical protein
MRFGIPAVAALLIGIGPSWVCAQQAIDKSDWTQGFMLKGAPLSFGGAFRALADTNAAILYNPAGIALKKGSVSLGADYVRNGPTDSQVFSGSVVDTQALEVMALGLSYDRDNPMIQGNRATVQQVTLAAASGSDMFFFGGSVKGYFTSAGSRFTESPDGADVDVGFLVKPLPVLALSLTGQNLIQGKKYEEFPLQLGFGTALILEPHLRLAIDLTKNFNTPASNGVNANFGAELRAMEGIYLRGGFGLDRIRNNNFYSVGATLIGPKVSLLFVFSQRLDPVDELLGANVELYF